MDRNLERGRTNLIGTEQRGAKCIKYDQKLQIVVDAYDEYDVLDFLKLIGSMI